MAVAHICIELELYEHKDHECYIDLCLNLRECLVPYEQKRQLPLAYLCVVYGSMPFTVAWMILIR